MPRRRNEPPPRIWLRPLGLTGDLWEVTSEGFGVYRGTREQAEREGRELAAGYGTTLHIERSREEASAMATRRGGRRRNARMGRSPQDLLDNVAFLLNEILQDAEYIETAVTVELRSHDPLTKKVSKHVALHRQHVDELEKNLKLLGMDL